MLWRGRSPDRHPVQSIVLTAVSRRSLHLISDLPDPLKREPLRIPCVRVGATYRGRRFVSAVDARVRRAAGGVHEGWFEVVVQFENVFDAVDRVDAREVAPFEDAVGDFVGGYLDIDDGFLPRHVERVLDHIERHLLYFLLIDCAPFSFEVCYVLLHFSLFLQHIDGCPGCPDTYRGYDRR